MMFKYVMPLILCVLQPRGVTGSLARAFEQMQKQGQVHLGGQARMPNGAHLRGRMATNRVPLGALVPNRARLAAAPSRAHQAMAQKRAAQPSRPVSAKTPQGPNTIPLVLTEKLGEGGFSLVWKCVYNGKEFAIKGMPHPAKGSKLIQNELSIFRDANGTPYLPHAYHTWKETFNRNGGNAFQQTFFGTDNIRSGLSNFVNVYNNVRPAGRHPITHVTFVVMDLAGVPSGVGPKKVKTMTDLFHLRNVRKDSVTPQRVVKILGGVAMGVAFLHGKNIIHRDIKPENLLFFPPRTPGEKEFTMCLTDFGFAGTMEKCTDGTIPSFAGTPEFQAPEVRGQGGLFTTVTKQEPATTFSDIYSLGVTFDQIITTSGLHQLRNVTGEYKLTTPQGVQVGVERVTLNELIGKMTLKTPTERLKADQVVQFLQTIRL